MITVSTDIAAPLSKVWDMWTKAEHITNWNFASPEWHCPSAINDLQPGGRFSWRMEAKDGSMGFDFEGTYDEVMEYERISYILGDGRKVMITINATDGGVQLTETFEAEKINSEELQQAGWQAILNNFKKYVESS